MRDHMSGHVIQAGHKLFLYLGYHGDVQRFKDQLHRGPVRPPYRPQESVKCTHPGRVNE